MEKDNLTDEVEHLEDQITILTWKLDHLMNRMADLEQRLDEAEIDEGQTDIEGSIPQEICRIGTERAFSDCPGKEFKVEDLISDIIAQFPRIEEEIQRSTMQTYIYDAIKFLKEKGMIKKTGRGKYRKMDGTEFDFQSKFIEEKELMDELCSDQEKWDGTNDQGTGI